MSSVSSVSGTDKFLQENTMDILNRDKNKTTDKKTEGASSSDFTTAAAATKDREREPSNELTFEDMLTLMCTQLQNQTIDNTADTNDMMNQLISMTVMQSLTTLTSAVEEVQTASVMNYSASLVGKEVTLGIYNEKTKETEEVYGLVEASGTYDGKQVIFVDGQSYFLSSIMAVGKLPPIKEGGDKPITSTPGTDETEGTEGTEGDNKDVENSGATEGTNGADGENNSTDDGTEAGDSGEVPVEEA